MTTRIDLKLATADRHEALDQAFSGFALTTLPGYSAFLNAHAAALLPLEARLEAADVQRKVPDWAARSRKAALLRDLAHLGLAVPGALDIPAIDPDGLGGAVYILEILRQNARSQLRHVEAATDPRLHAATHYLADHQDMPLWNSYTTWLDQQDAARFPAMLTAARQVADVFLLAAQRHHPERSLVTL
ncbi:heme oxygenase [Silvimonas terrae]|uniref:Heme oxygenase n=1 Tax=Silvimonas terrae TaxID=300266 RepID=A0A840RMV5_9NEIS|nr:biliverdin-producing heme oxygenase [Silvimonas terrae]MBB5193522.1 heme oxygenase [Silvimonas terrae]